MYSGHIRRRVGDNLETVILERMVVGYHSKG